MAQGPHHRNENVTDAYAYRYLGATVRNPGWYRFDSWDMRRAVEIHKGKS